MIQPNEIRMCTQIIEDIILRSKGAISSSKDVTTYSKTVNPSRKPGLDLN